MGTTEFLSDPSENSSPTLLLSNLNNEVLLVGARVELLQTSVLELSLWRPGQVNTANGDSFPYMLT